MMMKLLLLPIFGSVLAIESAVNENDGRYFATPAKSTWSLNKYEALISVESLQKRPKNSILEQIQEIVFGPNPE